MKHHGLFSLYSVSVLIAMFVAYYVSLLLGFLIFVVITLISKRVSTVGYVFLILLLGVISFTNYSDATQGDYDIVRYYDYWRLLQEAENIGQAAVVIYSFRGDYLFYFTEWIFCLVFPEDPRWFGFIFTSLTSFFIFLSLRNLANSEGIPELLKDRKTLLFFIAGFFCIIRFYDFTNAVRQHFAFSLLLYFMTLNVSLKKKTPLMLLTVGYHWTCLLVLLSYLLVNTFYKKSNFYNLLIIALSIGLIATPLFVNLLGNFDYAISYLQGNSLGVDRKIMVIVFVTALLISKIVVAERLTTNTKNTTLSLSIIALLFITHSTIIIRLAYNWTDFLTAISPLLFFVTLGKKHTSSQYKLYIAWGLFVIYNIMTIGRGEFEYMLFTSYGVMMPVQSVLFSQIPTGI